MKPSVSPVENGFTRRDAFRIFGIMGGAALVAPSLLRAAEKATPTAASQPSFASEPGFHRFKIGSLDALALHDGGFAPSLAEAPFGVGEPREKLAETLRDAFLPTDKVEIPFNVLLVKVGSELILVDAGCGKMYGPAGGQLVDNLAAAGIKPEQITAVVLTHLHADHFGGLFETGSMQPVFRNAKHFIHRKEFDFWSANMPDTSTMLVPDEMKKGFIERARTCLDHWKKWEFISGPGALMDGVEIIEAFGHTPGHIAVQFSSGSEQLLHFVDAAHHHALSVAHPDWKLAFDTRPDEAIATRKKLFDRAAVDRVRVFGGHMPYPSLGHIRRHAQGFEFLIEPSSIG
jgi:glyoxylase-like metal-dependent hydrolase (beta-lactamase superfamily II)